MGAFESPEAGLGVGVTVGFASGTWSSGVAGFVTESAAECGSNTDADADSPSRHFTCRVGTVFGIGGGFRRRSKSVGGADLSRGTCLGSKTGKGEGPG